MNNIDVRLRDITIGDKTATVIKLLKTEIDLFAHRPIIFVETDETAMQLRNFIKAAGFGTSMVHNGLVESVKKTVEFEWDTIQIDVLITTDRELLTGPNYCLATVHDVILYDIPKDIDEFVRRARFLGNRGRSYLLYDYLRDGPMLGQIVRRMQLEHVDMQPFLIGFNVVD